MLFAFCVMQGAHAQPVANPQTVTTPEDTPVTITLKASVNTTGFRIVALPRAGSLFQTFDGTMPDERITTMPAAVLNGEGKVIYVPPANASGKPLTAFQFGADEGETKSRAAMVKIIVTQVNDAPVAEPDTVNASRITPTNTIAVLANDRDVDGDVLKVLSFTQPASGTASLNPNGTLRFVPDARAKSISMDHFGYTITDGHGGQASASVNLIFDVLAFQAWPMMGNDAGHTGSADISLGSAPFVEAWSLSLPSDRTQPASITQGQVFVSQDFRFNTPPSVQALELNTGAVVWRHEFDPANSLTGPSCANGKVYVQRGNHMADTQLWCLDSISGSTLWNAPFGAQWESYLPPTPVGSSVFLDGGEYGGLYGFDSGTGRQLFFNVELPQYDGWTPTLTGGHLLSFTEGVLRGHDRDSGKVLWSLDVGWNWNGYTMDRTVAAADGKAWLITNNATTSDGDLVAVDLTTHKALWRATGLLQASTPAVAHGVVYALADSTTVPFSGEIRSFDAVTGKALRKYLMPNAFGSYQPVVTNDLLIASGMNGTFIFNVKTGALMQKFDRGGVVSVVTGRIIVSGTDQVVSCYAVPLPGNHAPVARAVSVSGDEDTDIVVHLTGTDADGNSLTTVVRSLPDRGTLYQTTDGSVIGTPISGVPTRVSNRDGKVIFRPFEDQNGKAYATFQFRMFDGKDLSADQTATINVVPVNDAPRALADTLVVRAGSTVTNFSPLANDYDIDGEEMTLVSFTQASPLLITQNGDGTLNLVCPPGVANGSKFSFSYIVRDPFMATATGTVTVEVSTSSSYYEWPTMGHDASHTGFYARPLGTSALAQLWSVTVDASAQPLAVAQGKVFATTGGYFTKGACVALDADTGGEVWRNPLPVSDNVNPPSWFGSAVYFQRAKGFGDTPELIAYHSEDGSEKWRTTFGAQWEHYMAPAIDATGVYVDGGYYGGIYGFDVDAGSQKFFLDLQQWDGWTPALHGTGLYSFVQGVFRSHNRDTGATEWMQDFTWEWKGYTMDRTIACDKGRAYFVNDPTSAAGAAAIQELLCLDLATHALRWRVVGAFSGTPAVANNIIYVNSGTQVRAYSASDGHFLLAFGSASSGYNRLMYRHLVVTTDLVLCGDGGATYLFNRQSAALVQTIPVAGYAVVAYDAVFIAGDDQTIRCFGSPALPTNHSPVAIAGQSAALEDNSAPLQLAATDADSDPLTFVVRSLPSGGKLYQTSDGTNKGAVITVANTRVSNTDGWLIFEPNPDVSGNGVGKFTFTAHDQRSTSVTQTFTVNVTAVNDPPIAYADSVSLFAGQTLTGFRPQANDRDADNDVLTLVAIIQGSHGSAAVISGTSITYTPQPGFNSGTDVLTYTIQDAAGVQASSTVTITIVGRNGTEWPTMGGGPDHASFVPDALGSATLTQRWAVRMSNPCYQVAVSGGRVFSTSNVYFKDSALIASDQASGAEVWRAAFSSSYFGLNPPTVFNDQVYLQIGNHSASSLRCLSALNGSTTWTSPFSAQWEHYLAPAVDSTGVYVNGGSYGGIYGFNPVTGTRKFFVGLEQKDEWTPTLHGSGLYSFVKGVFRSHNRTTGVVEWSKDFTWNYTNMNRTIACAGGAAFFVNDPADGAAGTAHDLICLDLTSRQVRWSVRDDFTASTPAVAQGLVYAITSGTSVRAYDVNNGHLIATYTTPGAGGLYYQPIVTNDSVIAFSTSATYVFDAVTGALRQTIAFGGYVSLAGRSLFIASSDSYVRCFGAEDPANPPPVVSPASVATPEDTDKAITLTATDTGTSPLQLVITSLPPKGSLYQTASGSARGTAITNVPALVSNTAGTVIYAPPLNGNGTSFTTFGYAASDGVSVSTTQLVTINVSPVNDAPVATPDVRSLLPGQILSPLNVLANDSDVDGDALAVTSFSQPAHGTVTQNSDGTLRYEPPTNATAGSESFSYTIGDGHGGAGTASVTLNIVSTMQGSWVTFGGDVSHTGYVPGVFGASAWSQRWSYAASNPAGIAVEEGKVFVTFGNTEVAALSQTSGTKLWQTSIPAESGGYNAINPPAWHNSRLYVVQGQQSYEGIVSLNASSGAQLWRKSVGSQWGRSLAPTVSDLGVFFNAGTYGGMYGFEFDGTQRFFAGNLPQTDHWTPALHQGGLYTFLYGVMRGHNITTGATSWSATLPNSSYSNSGSIACADGLAFVLGANALAAFDLAAHSLKWSVTGPFIGTPAVSNGSVFVLTSGGVSEYSEGDGHLLGTYPFNVLTYYTGNQPIVTDDLVICSDDYAIRIFNRGTRVLLQTLSLSNTISIALAGKQLLVTNSSGVTAYGQAPEVTFSPNGGTFTGTKAVTVTSAISGGVIRYTKDGSAPTLDSASVISGGGVTINQTGKLRAIVVSGSNVSGIYEASFTINPASAPAKTASVVNAHAPAITLSGSSAAFADSTTSSLVTASLQGANFVGSFTGIMSRDSFLNDMLGGAFHFDISSSAAYTCRLTLGKQTWRLAGRLSPSQDANRMSTVISLPFKTASEEVVGVEVDIGFSAATVAVSVHSTASSGDSYGTANKRSTATMLEIGRYGAALKVKPSETRVVSDHLPQGDGSITLLLSSLGIVTGSGHTPDGAAFTLSTDWNASGIVGLYEPLYQTNGSILGHITVEPRLNSNRIRGALDWWRKPNAPDGSYPAGWEDLWLEAQGSRMTIDR